MPRARARGGGKAVHAGLHKHIPAPCSRRYALGRPSNGSGGLLRCPPAALLERKSRWTVIAAGMIAAVIAIIGWSFGPSAAADPLRLSDSGLEPVKWSDLAGWMADDHLGAFASVPDQLPAHAQNAAADR